MTYLQQSTSDMSPEREQFKESLAWVNSISHQLNHIEQQELAQLNSKHPWKIAKCREWFDKIKSKYDPVYEKVKIYNKAISNLRAKIRNIESDTALKQHNQEEDYLEQIAQLKDELHWEKVRSSGLAQTLQHSRRAEKTIGKR